MAGMLPGVETARRRRLRGSGGWSDSPSSIASGFGSARIRFNHDTHLSPPLFLQTDEDDNKLGGAAREAKERLEWRLRGHLKKEIRRRNDQERSKGLQKENLGLKKRFGWGRMGLSRKSPGQDDSTICLDGLKVTQLFRATVVGSD